MRLKDLLREAVDQNGNEYDPDAAQILHRVSQGIINVNVNGNLYANNSLDLTTNNRLTHEFLEFEGDGMMLKYKLELVDGNFDASKQDLVTLENCPGKVTKKLYLWGNKFTSLEGITPYIGRQLEIDHNDKLTSLQGIGKMIKKCPEIILPANIQSHMLGLMMIKDLENIANDDDEISFDQLPEKYALAIRIINKHLGVKHDLMECQEELIQAKLKEYARL